MRCRRPLQLLLATLVGGLLVIPVPLGDARAAEPGEAERLAAAGERILTANCARCHAVGRAGASTLAAAPPFRQLARKYPVGHLAEALAEGITTGHAEMPEFVFSPDEIAAILAHLDAIAEPASPPAGATAPVSPR